MYKHCNLTWLVCESPLHTGSGSDLDFIDNPIQRERHTGYPKIESSSLKGALRERFAEEFGRTDSTVNIAFGPEDPKAGSERQGSLGFSDARLLLFPVKSMKGVFAWTTCPAVLQRLRQDMRRVDGKQVFEIQSNYSLNDGEAIVFSDELVIEANDMRFVLLEEYAFDAKSDVEIKVGAEKLQDWLAAAIFPATDYTFWQGELSKKLVILSDNDFADFVELTTEVITRNKIDPSTGTVAKGHLFTEEYLPADSVLYALVMSHAEFHKKGTGHSAQDVMDFFARNLTGKLKNTFQAGGNATIGKGILRTVLMNQPAPPAPAPAAAAEAVTA